MLRLNLPIQIKVITARLLANTNMQVGQTKIRTERGLPQGSCTSPALFNIFFDDALKEIAKVTYETLAYADDLAFTTRNRLGMIMAMNVLEKWCQNKRMTINKDKSTILVFRKDRRTQSSKDSEIKGVPAKIHYKYLGVDFQDTTNVDAQKEK